MVESKAVGSKRREASARKQRITDPCYAWTSLRTCLPDNALNGIRYIYIPRPVKGKVVQKCIAGHGHEDRGSSGHGIDLERRFIGKINDKKVPSDRVKVQANKMWTCS